MNGLRFCVLMAACGVASCKAPAETAAQVAADASVAAEKCADLDLGPDALLPETETATTRILRGEGISIRIDGNEVKTDTLQLKAGRHRIQAQSSTPGIAPMQFKFEVSAFQVATFDAQVDGPAITVLPLGIRCADCKATTSDIEIVVTASKPDALDQSARALALTDWPAAVPLLGMVNAAGRKSARFERQLAIVEALSGHSNGARSRMQKPKSALAAVLDSDDAAESIREGSALIDRWNELTNRYSQLTTAFSLKAPGPTGTASARFSKLSEAFTAASNGKDTLQQHQVLTAGMEALTALVTSLRASLPEDCASQQLISKLSRGAAR